MVLGLISLVFSINLRAIQNQVYRRGAEIAEEFLLYDPIARGDLITTAMPACAQGFGRHTFDNRMNGAWFVGAGFTPADGRVQDPTLPLKRQVLIGQGAFYLAVSCRQIKKSASLRPLRLGGENPILDKSEEEYHRGSSGDSHILGGDAFVDRILGQKQTVMRPKLSLVGLIKAVCRRYSIKERELRGSGRGHRLSEVRGMAAWSILELG